MRYFRLLFAALFLLLGLEHLAIAGESPLSAGFGKADITPKISPDRPVYLAGYGFNRKAVDVHDPLYVRCAVLSDGEKKIALASVDLVGLQYPVVLEIRSKLADFDYVMVASTHNHEAPDVVGVWGPSPLQRGVDDDYLQLVIEKTVAAIHQAEKNLAEVVAEYGTAEDESLLRDTREPYVKDGVMRTVRFLRAGDKQLAGILIQWSCHPEAMGSKNKSVTADFLHATAALIEQRYKQPVVLFSGAVGGLMTPPREDRVKDSAGNVLHEGDFEYARIYGEEVGKLAIKALESSQPLDLRPFVIAAKPIAIPVENPWFRAARAMNVLKRPGYVWNEDFEKLGALINLNNADGPTALKSEVAYLRLGDLHIACIPGEIYPELVYGKIQDPVDPAADYPDAAKEPSVVELLSGDKWLLIGLANDEVGYIIPRRQWDMAPPFAYGRKKSQYGEINSCGPKVAPVIMQALANRVREAKSAAAKPTASKAN